MKIFDKNFNKINLICFSIIIMFSIIGFSYCTWNDMIIFDYNLKSGQLEIEKNNEKSSYNINLDDYSSEFVIPLNIKNNSTVPLKVKNFSCNLYNEDVTEACKLVFDDYKDDEIIGRIIVNLKKIDEIIIQHENCDCSLLTEPVSISEKLSVEIEFMQANTNKNGWDEIIDFNISVNKTIMPLILEVVPVLTINENQEITIVNENSGTVYLEIEDAKNDELELDQTLIKLPGTGEIDKEENEEESPKFKETNIEDKETNLEDIETNIENIEINELESADVVISDPNTDQKYKGENSIGNVVELEESKSEDADIDEQQSEENLITDFEVTMGTK